MIDYIIADTHFGHASMLEFEPSRKLEAIQCGYQNFDDMLMNRWNRTIDQKTTILHLGDVALKNAHSKLKRLQGDITLLVGNHDSVDAISFYKTLGWHIIDKIILDIPESQVYLETLSNLFTSKQLSHRFLAAWVVDIGEERVLFSHFPLFDDNPYDVKYKPITEILEVLYLDANCTLNIHGHTHSQPAKESFCKSACLEMTYYEIKELGYFIS